MSSTRFNTFIIQVLKNEGGYVNHPSDPGGETKYGISKRAYPSVNIKLLTEQQAKDIYFRDYWNPLYDSITSNKIAFRLFDVGINIGKKKAVMKLQEALKSCNAPIAVDGMFGPNTLKYCNQIAEADVYPKFVSLLEAYYRALVAKNPKNSVFLKGWLNRLYKSV